MSSEVDRELERETKITHIKTTDIKWQSSSGNPEVADEEADTKQLAR